MSLTCAQLVISSGSLADIDGMCRCDAGGKDPHEVCGFLAGQIEGNQYIVRLGLGVQNSAVRDQHRRYQISTEAFIEAERLLQMQRLHILGLFHSHPDGRAWPSPLDIEYFFPGWIYLIIGVSADSVTERRAFQRSALSEAQFVEVGITVVSDDTTAT